LPNTAKLIKGPDRAAALTQYRRRADRYDLELALLEPIRARAIQLLALKPRDVVLDVGCGTGLSLERLREGIGARGKIIGIEQSPEMIAKARARIAQHSWRNVSLLCSPVESAKFDVKADAALFHFTHDILRQPKAIANVIAHLKPGARIVACGLKWTGGWALAANLFVLPAALHSVTSLEGLHEPWDKLAACVGPLQIQSLLLGAVYLASGRMPVAA
jgi:ubiquinone/menaquinone biosynthesis C-methylase UbiE